MRYITLITILTVFLHAAGTQANTSAYTMPKTIKKIHAADIAKIKAASNISHPDLIINVPIKIKNTTEANRKYYQSTGHKIKNIIVICAVRGTSILRIILPFKDASKTLAFQFRLNKPLHSHTKYFYRCQTWLRLDNNTYKPSQSLYDYFEKIVFRNDGTFIAK